MIRTYADRGGDITDATKARTVTFNNERVDVYVIGSGPSDG